MGCTALYVCTGMQWKLYSKIEGVMSIVIRSWGEPERAHTSVTALRMCVCMYVCMSVCLSVCLRPYTENFK